MFLLRLIELMDLSAHGHSWYSMDFYYKSGKVKDYSKFYRYFFVEEKWS